MAGDLLQEDGETRQFLTEAEAQLDVSLGRIMRDGPPADLQATENAQPAIVFHSLALLKKVLERGIRPAAVAGHSLGEFPALVAAGGLTRLDALLAVQARGLAMAAAAPAGSGMAAVLGLPDEVVEQVCARIPDVVPANYNAPGQVVISGRNDALDAAALELQKVGARRIVRLPVSAAFHSPLMAQAASTFEAAWDRVPLEPLVCPQVFNADAQVHREAAEVRGLMVRQLTGPVRWTQSVQRLEKLGVDAFLEIGPGKTLTGLVKKIVPRAVVHNIDDMTSLDAFLQAARA